MKKVMVALIMTGGLFLVGTGCGKDEPKAGEAKSGDSIGVAECDAYFKAVDACIAKNAAMKGAMETAMKSNREAWKKAAETPAGKEGLKAGCKAATDAIKQSCP